MNYQKSRQLPAFAIPHQTAQNTQQPTTRKARNWRRSMLLADDPERVPGSLTRTEKITAMVIGRLMIH